MRRACLQHLLSLAALILVSEGCDRSAVFSDPARATVPINAYVTGRAADAIGADGLIRADALVASDENDIITANRAAALAVAYIGTFGQFFHDTWDQEHGAPLDLSTLRAARIYLAESPYTAVPTDAHPGIRNAYGSYYLVTFASDGAASLLVAVAAHNTRTTIDAGGRLVLPPAHGNDFWGEGIPLNGSRDFRAYTPEEAIALVGGLTHARVIDVPKLVLRGAAWAPVTALWKLSLDRRIPVHASAGVDSANEVIVGTEPARRFLRTRRDQPSAEAVAMWYLNRDGSRRGPVDFSLGISTGHAVNFDYIDLEGH